MTQTVTHLFHHLEELRRKARLSMTNGAALTGVSKRAYVAWSTSDGAIIKPFRKKDLQYAIFIMEQGFRTRQLPIKGHDRRPETTAQRDEVVKDLMECYPKDPTD